MKRTLSVVLATHNPSRAVLGRTLGALARQTLTPAEWETILVDNASRPPVAPSDFAAVPPNFSIVTEPRLGLTPARLAGMSATRNGLVVFIDDDNLPDPDYLDRAQAFFAAHPEVGAAGGRILPEFAREPAGWAQRHLGLLALRDHGDKVLVSAHAAGAVTAYDSFAPIGAGMIIRAEVSRAYAEWHRRSPLALSDRTGSELGSCGDCEIVLAALRAGYQMAYAPELRLTHLIPERRLAFRYLVRLSHDGAVSWSQFRVRHGLIPSIAPWTVGLRQARAFFVQRAWTPAGYIAWRGICGQFEGMALQ